MLHMMPCSTDQWNIGTTSLFAYALGIAPSKVLATLASVHLLSITSQHRTTTGQPSTSPVIPMVRPALSRTRDYKLPSALSQPAQLPRPMVSASLTLPSSFAPA